MHVGRVHLSSCSDGNRRSLQMCICSALTERCLLVTNAHLKSLLGVFAICNHGFVYSRSRRLFHFFVLFEESRVFVCFEGAHRRFVSWLCGAHCLKRLHPLPCSLMFWKRQNLFVIFIRTSYIHSDSNIVVYRDAFH